MHLAKLASKEYRDKGTPLNDTIKKLASEHKLNSHQTARVCEEANLHTFLENMKTAKRKDFEFDVADQSKILDSEKKEMPSSEKEASICIDYKVNPDFLNAFYKTAEEDEDDYEIKQPDKESDEEEKDEEKERKEKSARIEDHLRAEAARKKLASHKLLVQLQMDSIKKDLVNTIKTSALLRKNPFTAWPTLSEKYASCKNIIDEVFTKAVNILAKDHRIKVADMLLEIRESKPESWNEPAKALMENHGFIKRLDTISAYSDLHNELEQRLRHEAPEDLYEKVFTPSGLLNYKDGDKKPLKAELKKIKV